MIDTAAALDISAEVARIHAAAYERDHEPVTTALDGDVAVCVIRIGLSPAEQLLIANGRHDAVLGQRRAFEHELAPTMSAAVERVIGHSVTAFVAETHFDPDLTLLIFVLAPAAAPPSA